MRRRRRWFVRGLISCGFAATAVLAMTVLVDVGDHRVREVGTRTARVDGLAPTRVAKSVHLDAAYVAPAGRVAPALGRLRLGRLGIDAPVVAVGWDAQTMAVPNDPRTLGWFEPSARLHDLAGSSLIAGHVSDASDRLGPLSALVRVRSGDVVEWRGSEGVIRFRVIGVQRFPRARGLPPSLFRVDGPHVLRLVTCTNRVVGPAGTHYVDNLVVSAVQD